MHRQSIKNLESEEYPQPIMLNSREKEKPNTGRTKPRNQLQRPIEHDDTARWFYRLVYSKTNMIPMAPIVEHSISGPPSTITDDSMDSDSGVGVRSHRHHHRHGQLNVSPTVRSQRPPVSFGALTPAYPHSAISPPSSSLQAPPPAVLSHLLLEWTTSDTPVEHPEAVIASEKEDIHNIEDKEWGLVVARNIATLAAEDGELETKRPPRSNVFSMGYAETIRSTEASGNPEVSPYVNITAESDASSISKDDTESEDFQEEDSMEDEGIPVSARPGRARRSSPDIYIHTSEGRRKLGRERNERRQRQERRERTYGTPRLNRSHRPSAYIETDVDLTDFEDYRSLPRYRHRPASAVHSFDEQVVREGFRSFHKPKYLLLPPREPSLNQTDKKARLEVEKEGDMEVVRIPEHKIDRIDRGDPIRLARQLRLKGPHVIGRLIKEPPAMFDRPDLLTILKWQDCIYIRGSGKKLMHFTFTRLFILAPFWVCCAHILSR
jgi:hypothetical protein